MRAARFHRFGSPEVLQFDTVPWPFPARDEVLIRVAASSVNGTDLRLRAGGLGLIGASQLPFTPGFDVSGEVVDIGPQVTAFRPGDRVYALLGHRGGGAAEDVIVSQRRVAIAPTQVPLVEAAAVPLSGLTALQALRGPVRVGRGTRVLVYGAAGGIGAFAVRLARLFGAHVTGVARPEKLAYVEALGADAARSSAEVSLETTDERWDVILDTPPALRFHEARQALTAHGVLVSTRPFPSTPSELLGALRSTGPRFAAVRTAERGLDLAFLTRLIDSGELTIPLDRLFSLEQIREAHAYLEGPDVRGKVVVTVSGDQESGLRRG
ncbi:NADP-dependent oxidoreductase [Deinococcus sp.]|uniref:NADP-dependent oxidoreductase n=1 Tax=Deinococcus sp. TaxID=47478 RepID=UPI003C7B27C0